MRKDGKQMKNVVSIVLLVCMLLSLLAGCGLVGKEESKVSSETEEIKSEQPSETKPEEPAETKPTETKPTETKPTETKPVEDAQTKPPDITEEKPDKDPDKDPSEGVYEKGLLTDTSFESEYLNIRFSLPEGFVMATKEDMENLMNIGADAFDIDKITIDYAKVSTIYEMMASSPMGTPNVIVMAEKLMLSNITEDQYIEALKDQLANLSAMNYTFGEKIENTTLAGEKYKKLVAEANLSGQSMIQEYIFRKLDDRMIGFVFTYTPETEDEVKLLLKAFSPF